jgi:catechol 2,3-dioxygenase-like lactoylglutathione lyase family enzyme
VNRLHHVALGARDPERVAAFYRDLLGLRELKRHAGPDGSLRSVWLDLGGSVLMIEATQEPARFVQSVGAGPFLIAVGAGAEQRAGLERALGAAGFPVESRTDHTTYLRDPEGNRVAVSSLPWVWPA